MKYLLKYSLFICVLAAAMPAQAVSVCRCQPTPSVEQALNDAEAVFLGTARKVYWRGGVYEHTEFDVEKGWKSVNTPEFKVLTVRPNTLEVLFDDLNCNYEFTQGKRYLVYTYRDKNSPDKVSSCSRTQEAEQAGADIEILGAPRYEAVP